MRGAGRLQLASLMLAFVLLLSAVASAELVARVGYTGEPDSITGRLTRKLQEAIAQQPGGLRLTLSQAVSQDEGRGEDLDLIHLVIGGKPQMAIVRASPLANFHRPWGLLSAPYLDFPQSQLLGPVGNRGLQALGIFDLGPRLLASRRPTPGVSGLEGLRVRVSQNLVAIESAKAFAMIPVPGTIGRVPEMVDLKAIEAAELSYHDLQDLGLIETFPQVLDLGLGRESLVLIVNDRFYQSLTQKQQSQLRQAALEVTEISAEWTRQSSKRTEISTFGKPDLETLKMLSTKVQRRAFQLAGHDPPSDPDQPGGRLR